jgi:hypothetical protein
MDHCSSDAFLSYAKKTHVTATLGGSLANIRGGRRPPFILAVLANGWFLLIAES